MRNFIVGDIIKGKKDNGYKWTEERMTKAKVLNVNGPKMQIEILEHEESYYVGCRESVDNTYTKFELVNAKKVTRKELLDMPIGTKIITNAKTNNEYVYDGESFCSKKGCIVEYDIEDDLTLDFCDEEEYGTKIVKIEEPKYSTIYDYSIEAQEMTIAEIEKALGHAVKIIKEED